jgi:uncharacterized protein (DUF2342 family)
MEFLAPLAENGPAWLVLGVVLAVTIQIGLRQLPIFMDSRTKQLVELEKQRVAAELARVKAIKGARLAADAYYQALMDEREANAEKEERIDALVRTMKQLAHNFEQVRAFMEGDRVSVQTAAAYQHVAATLVDVDLEGLG